MTLARLEIEGFRCLEPTRLEFDPRYNLIVGPNASGKTSLLEALFFLGRGRSFRTRRLDRMIREGEDAFRLVGWVRRQDRETVLGISGQRSGTEIRVGGAPASSAAMLAEYFPPQIIDPEVHKLLEEGPNRRRRYLDWGVFHVEPHFLEVWQRYHRALRQRTAALRPGGDAKLAVMFEPELLASGLLLDELRRHYLARLAEPLRDVGQRILGLDLKVAYQPGWPQDSSYEAALRRSRDRDERLGITHVGPHRADLSVRVGGVLAKERVSRGQQKLVAAALVLAQLMVQQGDESGRAALLLDDPAAELDGERLAGLLGVVRELSVQLFVTALAPELKGLGQPGVMFHVEHGHLRAA